ncbi:MAG: PBP1A family penicillin-binding protein [Alphaproteobacteria bacterium]|nr:PBP1A family penicillin-binding protein [Alphaproteobacteria bacterium]
MSEHEDGPRRRFPWRPLGLVAAGLVVGLLAGGAWAYLWLKPNFPDLRTAWDAGKIPSLVFLDKDGKRIATRGAIREQPVPAGELPKMLIDAFLATEDRRFWTHPGVDWRGVTRAVFVNLRAGRFVQGGSTITQQVAKNLFLTNERSMRRKLQEALLAVWLERHMSKNEILTLYLNRIYFGAGTYGIEAAAETYFGHSAREVSLAEAAMLAGLPQAPSKYAPTSDLAAAQARAGDVLRNMVEAHFLREADIAPALAEPATPRPQLEAQGAAYFLDYAVAELERLKGRDALDLDLVVTTTLDPRLQKIAEEAVATRMAAEADAAGAKEAALVMLSPDGSVRAMVGGRSYADSQFNRAVQAKRQPGSAFKPFVYLTALEAGLTPQTVREDAPITVDDWSPENYGRTYRGYVTLREAVANSLNTVAVRVSEEVGRANVVATAQRLGIRSSLLASPSIALGTSEVSLLELTDAYLPFATLGLAEPPRVIERIATPEGGTLWEAPPVEPRRVMSHETAAEMNGMLHEVLVSGTAKNADLTPRPAAAKTGTSQDWRDAWIVGYTADLVTGVWVGNDDASPMNRVTGGGLPARIWKDAMENAHAGWAVADLEGATTDYAYPTLAANDPSSDFYDRLSASFSGVRHNRTLARSEPRRDNAGWKSILPWNW